MAAANDLEIAIDQPLATELEADVVLGGDAVEEELVARAANQPIAFKLREVLERLNKPVPSQFAPFYEMFEVWLVPHRVSIIRRSGNAEVTCVGMQVEYHHKDTTCSVVSLIPSPQFLRHGHVGAQMLFQGKVSAAGDVSATSEESGFESEKELGRLTIGVTASGEIGFKFCAEVVTPFISAVGIGASSCEWRFDKHADALFGRDIETWTLLALPKRQATLSYRLRYYVCSRVFLFPTRRQSKWVELPCVLS